MSKHQESLGNESIPKLLFKQSTPAIIAMLVFSLYNIADTLFIGRGVGPLGIAGVSIVLPIFLVSMAVSFALGVGASSIISRALGAKEFSKANKTMGNFVTLSILSSLFLIAIGFIFLTPILKLFGATDLILPYAKSYLIPLLFGTGFIIFASGSNNIVRAEGNSKYAMVIMLSSVFVNIILDPIFIFGLNMGMAGAAWATTISEFVAALFAVKYFFFGKTSLKIRFNDLILKKNIIKETFAIGASSFARNISSSLIGIFMNNSLAFYGGEIAIAAFGIIHRMFMFTLMPLFGLVQGLMPIVGYNYGAKRNDRVISSVNLSIKVSTVMSIVAFLIIMLLPKFIASWFTTDISLINMTQRAIRIMGLMLPLIGFQVMVGGMYQALGRAKMSLFLSLLRQIILVLPLIIVLPLFFKLDGVWLTAPVADFFAAVITGIIFRKEVNKLLVNQPSKNN